MVNTRQKIKRMGTLPSAEDLRKFVKQRSIPIKFCYSGKGGNKWHKLRQDKSYKLGEREFESFESGLKNIEKVIGTQPINLIHLGPGDGIEIPVLFEKFKLRNGLYVGVDISEQMLRNTFQLNKSYFSDVHPLWYLTDIEIPGNLELVCKDVKKKRANRNLILLTGAGTLCSNPQTLKNLSSSMDADNYSLITLEGDNPDKRKEICATYDLPFARNLLSVGLERAGYNSEEGKFETIFNEKDSKVEVYFKPRDEEKILCLTSYKPREDEFRKKLIDSEFDIQNLDFYKDAHTFAVLCSRRN